MTGWTTKKRYLKISIVLLRQVIIDSKSWKYSQKTAQTEDNKDWPCQPLSWNHSSPNQRRVQGTEEERLPTQRWWQRLNWWRQWASCRDHIKSLNLKLRYCHYAKKSQCFVVMLPVSQPSREGQQICHLAKTNQQPFFTFNPVLIRIILLCNSIHQM